MPATATDRLVRIHALLDDLTSSPGSHDVLELVLATALSLKISRTDETAPVWLLIVGPPSDGKTFALQLLKEADDRIYWLDTVTENFLASAYVNERTGEPAPDLFRDLDGKCVAIKELGTVFSLRPEKVKKFIGDLQAIYDGDYSKATGTVGTIRGKAMFSMAACVTPATLHGHQEYMGRIGPRFLTCRLGDLSQSEEDEGLAMLWDGADRKDRIRQLRQLVSEHLRHGMSASPNLRSETRSQQDYINRLAQMVAYGRTVVSGRVMYEDDRKYYEREVTQREGPYRVQQQLRNLARGLALVHARDHVTDHELELVRRVALASLPADRALVVRLLARHPEGLTAIECAAGIRRSTDRARQLLDDLVLIGILEKQRGGSSGGAPPSIYIPVSRFADLLSSAIAPIDHALDLTGNFTDKTDTLKEGGISEQSCQESAVGSEATQ